MTTINTSLKRRSFLKASAAVGGGLVLGFNWSSCTSPQDVKTMPEDWYDMNAFLKIGENGLVTIMSPNPEIGQNVKTSMPMIVAEELDVNWDDVIVEQAGLDKGKYTRQIAGGSQSIGHGWTSLRTAGATCRQMLVNAAANSWDLEPSELNTDNGMISHKDTGMKMGYGEAAVLAAGTEVPTDVKLKDPKDFKIIGTTRGNVDIDKIITGTSQFGIDTKKEGMLIAMVEHPPAFGMKIKSVDSAAAKAMPGIVDVVTVNVVPKDKQWSDVNAFGDLIAVVGKSTWQVMKAKKALKIEWEVDSKLESSSDHDEGMARLLNDGSAAAARSDGNTNSAFKNAAKIIEQTYIAPYLAHNTMEPMNFFADVTSDKAELLGPIQTPEYLSKSLSSILDMPEDNISIMMTRMGGGFGRRLYGHFGVEAAVISKQVNAPVNLIYSREDDMTQGTYRPAYRVSYKAGLDAEGNMIAFEVKGAGTQGGPVFANRFPAGTVDNYTAANYTLDSNISTGAWRAPRSNFMAYAEQAFLDEVAEAAGKDPIDFRLSLFDKAIKNPVGENNDYDAERYAGVLKLIKEKAGWGQDIPGVHRGVSAYYCHNSYVAQVVDVKMENNLPRVQKVWCAVDCGIVVNPGAAKNQIEGGIVDGIGHAMYSAMSFKDGQPEQSNFHQYRLIRHNEAPLDIETFFVDNGIDPTGLGEPSLPPIAAALANALYQATGKRANSQPFTQQKELLG